MIFLEDNDSLPLEYIPSSENPIAIGGSLTPEILIDAYRKGLFPWFSKGDPIMWWSLDPRMILYPGDFKKSKSLLQSIRRENFVFKVNNDFDSVINACSGIDRKGQADTWITSEMIFAYRELYKRGKVLSIETYSNDKLCGGLYGVKTGSLLSGESMFSFKTDASKAALMFLCENSDKFGIKLIDCQQPTSHLKSLGAICVPGTEYLSMLWE
jgi:leucyl/phenylalanyl-tRNA--protein transferase